MSQGPPAGRERWKERARGKRQSPIPISSSAVCFIWNKLTKGVAELSRSRTGYFVLEISEVRDTRLGIPVARCPGKGGFWAACVFKEQFWISAFCVRSC